MKLNDANLADPLLTVAGLGPPPWANNGGGGGPFADLISTTTPPSNGTSFSDESLLLPPTPSSTSCKSSPSSGSGGSSNSSGGGGGNPLSNLDLDALLIVQNGGGGNFAELKPLPPFDYASMTLHSSSSDPHLPQMDSGGSSGSSSGGSRSNSSGVPTPNNLPSSSSPSGSGGSPSLFEVSSTTPVGGGPVSASAASLIKAELADFLVNSDIDDIAALIGSAIADQPLVLDPTTTDGVVSSSTMDAWTELDEWIQQACYQVHQQQQNNNNNNGGPLPPMGSVLNRPGGLHPHHPDTTANPKYNNGNSSDQYLESVLNSGVLDSNNSSNNNNNSDALFSHHPNNHNNQDLNALIRIKGDHPHPHQQQLQNHQAQHHHPFHPGSGGGGGTSILQYRLQQPIPGQLLRIPPGNNNNNGHHHPHHPHNNGHHAPNISPSRLPDTTNSGLKVDPFDLPGSPTYTIDPLTGDVIQTQRPHTTHVSPPVVTSSIGCLDGGNNNNNGGPGNNKYHRKQFNKLQKQQQQQQQQNGGSYPHPHHPQQHHPPHQIHDGANFISAYGQGGGGGPFDHNPHHNGNNNSGGMGSQTSSSKPSLGLKSKKRSSKSPSSSSSSNSQMTTTCELDALGKEKPIHRCGICNRGFLNKSNIKVHLRTHTGEKPFKCDVCGKAFRQKAHLLKHIQIHKRIHRD